MVNRMKGSSCRPNYAIPPGETLRETLETMGMTQAELAHRMGRPKKTINEIMTAKAAITAETALQLERVLGVPASFWNNLERNYREALARIAEEEALKEHTSWAERFPVAALVKLGWISRKDSPVEQIKAVLGFFGVAGIAEWTLQWGAPGAAYRESKAYRTDPAAVAAWLRKGELEAAKGAPQPYKASMFKSGLQRIRGLTRGSSGVFGQEMTQICARAGVAVAFVPEIPGVHVYGATRWLKPTKALIQMSLRGKRDDHLWFTFFHEAGHILLHDKKEVFIEANQDGKEDEVRESKEQEASRFAQDFLIPCEVFEGFVRRKDFSLESIRTFAGKVGIAPGIVVGRLQHDGIIPFSHGNGLKKKLAFEQK